MWLALKMVHMMLLYLSQCSNLRCVRCVNPEQLKYVVLKS